MSDAIQTIRQELAGLLAVGLNRLEPAALAKLRQVLEANGFQRSVVLLNELGAQQEPGGRFKAFTKFLLAVRQLDVAMMPFPRLKSGAFVMVPGMRGFAVPQSFASLEGPEPVRRFLADRPTRVPGLYLLAEKMDPAKLTLHELVPLLSHTFYRDAVLDKLRQLPEERREALGNKLIEIRNRPIRRAGISLLASLGARLSAMKALLPLLGEPATQREVAGVFLALGSRALAALGASVDSESEAQREQSARLLRAIGDKQAQVPLKRFVHDPSPAVRAWAKLGLAAIGAQDPSFLQACLSEPKDHLLRIYGKLQLVKNGHLPLEKLTAELGNGGWRNFKLTVPALAELDNADRIFAPVIDRFRSGKTREERREAFEMLQHLPYAKYRSLFRLAASDCDGDIARKGLELAVRAEGFAALDRFSDLSAVMTKPYEQFSPEERQYARDQIFPHIPEVGDCRFVPYLEGLIREVCFTGTNIEYTYSLRPALIEFGAPLIGMLRRLATDPIVNIAGAAGEVLGEIGAKLS